MSNTKLGRLIGAFLLLQFFSLMVGFILMKPAVTTEFLQQAVAYEGQLRIAVGVLTIGSAATVVIAILFYDRVRQFSVGASVLLVVASTIWVIGQLVDDVHIMSMFSLSKRLAETPGSNQELYNLLALQVRSTRVWAHYTELFVMDVWFAVFYGLLFVFGLVPRWLAGIFGLLAVALHLIGLPIALYGGYPMIMEFAYGLLAAYITIGGWLLVKGFSVMKDPAYGS